MRFTCPHSFASLNEGTVFCQRKDGHLGDHQWVENYVGWQWADGDDGDFSLSTDLPAETADDVAQLAAEQRWQGNHSVASASRVAFVAGAAWQRAQVTGEVEQ